MKKTINADNYETILVVLNSMHDQLEKLGLRDDDMLKGYSNALEYVLELLDKYSEEI